MTQTGTRTASYPEGTAAPVRVMLVDHHPLVQAGLRSVVAPTDTMDLVGCASTLVEGVEVVGHARPNVVLVGSRLPDGSGVEFIRELRAREPRLPCVLFAHEIDNELFFRAVVAGAAGCLPNDVGIDDLSRAVATVAGGGSLITPEVIDGLRRRADTAVEHPALSRLTPTERRIVSMVGRGMTNREIAAELSLAEKTIRNYVSSILAKVGLRNRTELAAFLARTVPPERREAGRWHRIR